MTIPDFPTIILPMLKLMNDGNEHRLLNLNEELANHFKLSEEERNVLTF